jgi:plastocyanin
MRASRRLLGALASLALICTTAVFAAEALAANNGGAAASRTVVLRNVAFSPPALNVRTGDVVRWVWRDGSIPHNVTTRSFRSKTQTSGSFAVRFRHPGTFSYVCTLHPQMKGRIVVQ